MTEEELLKNKRGMLVQIYKNTAKIVLEKQDNSSVNTGTAVIAFNSYRKDTTAWTEGKLCNFIDRYLNECNSGWVDVEFYHFNTLGEFAQAVLDNGWIL